MADALARDPALRRAFTYRPNSSLYRVAGQVRYVESRLTGTLRSYHLVAIEPSEALEATLARARGGARFDALAAALVDDEISLAEAEDYVGELIQSQVIVPDVAVPVTGPEPVHVLVDELGARRETAAIARPLAAARDAIHAIDAAGPGAPPERYRAIARALEALPTKVELPRLFQVDMVKPAPGATLGGAVLAEITAGVELLYRLGQRSGSERLARFRDAFTARYEGREVPLVEALDEEAGVGFEASSETSPLLQDLAFPGDAPEPVPWGPREALLLRKLGEALQSGREEIVLEPGDVEKIASRDSRPLPRAFAVMVSVVAASDEELSRGRFRVLLGSPDGPPGARLLGRFCHADGELRSRVEQYLRAEEAFDPEAMFAEIVHLPEGRLGNILLRPILREYEIPFLGRSGAPEERQLPITDLMVSVVGGEIVVRSARLRRRVVPRMTTAHHYAFNSLGLYRFLCDLQTQGVARGGWSWGPLQGAPFLPRVAMGRLVLARARWTAYKDELAR
ncbi:MAG: lantibiotic dehydratase family protein, partial [Candidatus Limnocylindria bacterium]